MTAGCFPLYCARLSLEVVRWVAARSQDLVEESPGSKGQGAG